MPIPPVPHFKGVGEKKQGISPPDASFAINGILKAPVTAYLAGLSTFAFNVGKHT